MTALHRRQDVIDLGDSVLAEMRALAPSLVFASLVTDDGFGITHTPNAATTIDSGRFASMTSSVQALSDAVGRELRIGTGEYIVIAAENGYALQLRVPGHPVILAALFDMHETLGKALSISRRGADKLATALSLPTPPRQEKESPQ